MEPASRAKQVFRAIAAWFSLIFFVLLSGLVRCHNFHDIFIHEEVYFVDADCYSRMTRVRMVLAHPLTIIRRHDFENHPQGIAPHTTMPMDWLIALLATALKPFSKSHVDLAGALVSPLLGILTTAFLWFWSQRIREPFGGAMLLLISVSPILVHGTLLGRPDHQSLLIFLLAVALGAEVLLARESSRGWGITSGAAWALALWVSLYEPLILLAAALAAQLVFFRAKFFTRERRLGFAVFAALLMVAAIVERWHFQLPDATMRQFFPAWKSTIGELESVPLFSSAWFHWCGLAVVVLPFLLLLKARSCREVLLWLPLLFLAFGLTLTQQRWGYFFALIFAMSLPWALAWFRRKWLVWPLFALSLWPVARAWEATIFPDETRAAQLAERRDDSEQLRDVAQRLALAPHGGILAPWWFCPPLAYWSSQACVAGSSHESLSGIVETARFQLAAKPDDALAVLEKRRVRWVVAYDSSRVIQGAAALLNQAPGELPMARVLDERPHSAPSFLQPRYANRAFKIFEVETKLQP